MRTILKWTQPLHILAHAVDARSSYSTLPFWSLSIQIYIIHYYFMSIFEKKKYYDIISIESNTSEKSVF